MVIYKIRMGKSADIWFECMKIKYDGHLLCALKFTFFVVKFFFHSFELTIIIYVLYMNTEHRTPNNVFGESHRCIQFNTFIFGWCECLYKRRPNKWIDDKTTMMIWCSVLWQQKIEYTYSQTCLNYSMKANTIRIKSNHSTFYFGYHPIYFIWFSMWHINANRFSFFYAKWCVCCSLKYPYP